MENRETKIMKLGVIFLSILLLQSLTTFGQNLVTNSGFEDYKDCINEYGEIEIATGWYQQHGSTDYFNACCKKKNFVGVPSNYNGYQQALGGNAYAGLYLFYFDREYRQDGFFNREYLHTELLVPLKASEKYIITFYFSLADSSEFYTDHFSVCLSKSKRLELVDNFEDVLKCNCKIQKHIAKNEAMDTAQWHKFEYEYIAEGGEKFITLGFFDKDLSKASFKKIVKQNRLAELKLQENSCYYYIDDVSVVHADSKLRFAK